MTIWTSYMPAGAGAMMLIAAVILPGTSWRARLAGGVGRVAAHAAGAAAARRAAARARRPAGQPTADPARDGRSGDQRRLARHRGLLRRLFLLLAGHRGLPADPAGRAPGLLDLDGGDRHGIGDRGERRRQPLGRLPAAARRAARRRDRRCGDLHGLLRRRHLHRRRARPVAPGAGRHLFGGDRRRARRAVHRPARAFAAARAGRRLDRAADAGLQHGRPDRPADHRRAGCVGRLARRCMADIHRPGGGRGPALFLHWRERRKLAA